MSEKISKIQVMGEIYELADYSLLDVIQNEGKYLKVENNQIVAVDLPKVEETKVSAVEADGVGYDYLEDAIAAISAGTIKLNQDLEVSTTTNIIDGKDIVLDMNGHSIFASSGFTKNASVLKVKYGGKLTVTGHGYIDGRAGQPIGVFGEFKDTGKTGTLIIENGTFIGNEYAITGNGSATECVTDITINDGIFKVHNKHDGVAIYHPQKGTLTINNGEFEGATAIEVRAGDVIINDGMFKATAGLTIVANGNGACTTGCAVAVAQHSTKKPISVAINNGVFQGQSAFYECNPLQNDEAATSQIKLALNGGHYLGDFVNQDLIYSETQTHFVDGEKIHCQFSIIEDYLM